MQATYNWDYYLGLIAIDEFVISIQKQAQYVLRPNIQRPYVTLSVQEHTKQRSDVTGEAKVT